MSFNTITGHDAGEGKQMSYDTTEEKMQGCIAGVIVLAMSPFIILFHGWCLHVMWGWFLVPALPALPWSAAVGVCLVWYMMQRFASKSEVKDKSPFNIIATVIGYQIGMLCVVGIGWIYHLMGFGFTP
jgi:hypothetical protein